MIVPLRDLPPVTDPVAAQIACLFTVYAHRPAQASFGEQQINGQTTACFSLMAGQMNVVALAGVDAAEWRSYHAFCGHPTVFCTAETAKRLGLTGGTEDVWYACEGQREACPLVIGEDTPRRVAEQLAGAFPVQDTDTLVADLTVRYYSGGALLYENGQAAGVLLCAPSCAYLNGLVTIPQARHTGQGSRVLQILLAGAGYRTTYVCCHRDVAPFYEKNGFVYGGKVGYYRE